MPLHHSDSLKGAHCAGGALAGCYEPTCQILLFSYTLRDPNDLIWQPVNISKNLDISQKIHTPRPGGPPYSFVKIECLVESIL